VLPSYPAYFHSREKKLSQSCGSTFHYIDGAISLNNERLSDLLVRFISVSWIENIDTTDIPLRTLEFTPSSNLEIDDYGRLKSKLHNKREELNFPIVNFLAFIVVAFKQHMHTGFIFTMYININLYGSRRGRDRTTNYMQSVAIVTKIVSSNPVHCEVYSIQNYVIKFVSNLWHVGGLLRFSPPIKLTATL
jgi:hypothetical protein